MTNKNLTSKNNVIINDNIKKNKNTNLTNNITFVIINDRNVIVKKAVFKTYQYLIQEKNHLRI